MPFMIFAVTGLSSKTIMTGNPYYSARILC